MHRNVKKGGCTWRPPHAKYCMTTLEFVGILKSYPSMLARIKAPPEKAFFTMYGPSLVRANFPLWSGMTWLCFLKTRLPSSKTLGLTFLLNAQSMWHWYNCPWHIVVMRFSSIMAHCGYALLVYHGTLWLCASRLSCSISKWWDLYLYREDGFHAVNQGI